MHTLGPQATDSNAAAERYVKLHPNLKIKLHVDFLDVLNHLNDYSGDLLLIPMAYQDHEGNSLGDYHYQLIDKMHLIDTIITDLDPIVVIENHSNNHKLYTHPATIKLAEKYQNGCDIITTNSKYAAYQSYLIDGKLVITNQKNVAKLAPDETILQTIHSKMSWCIYQIGGVSS
ncbi:amino acid biosynthesis protein [Fructilactobacillus sp. Tb1]|uniref:amino acid biosynthesis protein n=1 Tax=Fructilactobacillus sp. Tb1 TaxID=3422304 RepID=UPI003D2C41AD